MRPLNHHNNINGEMIDEVRSPGAGVAGVAGAEGGPRPHQNHNGIVEEEDVVDGHGQPMRRPLRLQDEEDDDNDMIDGDGDRRTVRAPSHPPNCLHPEDHHEESSQGQSGFLSSFLTRILPSKRTPVSDTLEESDDPDGFLNGHFERRAISTQTEASLDPLAVKGQQLSYLVIQELALRRKAPKHLRDDVLESLCHCVSEILEKHSILFNGMVHRIGVAHYQMFDSVANELFEANSNNENGRLRITWGRIVSLYAFAVRLAQEYREDPRQVQAVTRYLATYVTKHIISFVRESGGWSNLVVQFPLNNDTEDQQFRRAILWSGLCVGIVATMYVSSLLRG